MLDMVMNLISEQKIPALNPQQMEAFLHYLFTATPPEHCIRVFTFLQSWSCHLQRRR